jgi:hypothetical protein
MEHPTAPLKPGRGSGSKMTNKEMRRLWTPAERSILDRLDAPIKIQNYLNTLAYDPRPGTASPRRVLKEGRANCFEGALLAAAIFRFHGRPPLIVDIRSWNDDDHVLAVFRQNGAWGCVAKSNFTVLRFREPVYRTIRELMLSYFDVYFNAIGEKTMRAYSVPFDVSRLDGRGWMTTDEDISGIGDALDRARHYPVLTAAQIRDLQITDPDLVKAGLMLADPTGLFSPKK